METFENILNEAQRIVVLTGAGMSTESGIPDFRSAGRHLDGGCLKNGSDEC